MRSYGRYVERPRGRWGAQNIARAGMFSPTGRSPQIVLSANTVAEDAAIDTVIGTHSVINGSGTYTFTITADPDSKFDLDGDDLITAASFDYESATSHQYTVEADNGIDPPFTATITVNVTNVTASSAAGILLDANGDIGFAMVASDDSMVIRDFATPAHDFAGAPGSKWTTTRSGATAMYRDSSGVMQVASANTLRRDFDPRLGALVPGYLSEGARTNLLLRSSALDNASWTKFDATVTADSIAGPNGVTEADLVTETTTIASSLQNVTVSSGAVAVLSPFLKRGNTDWVRLLLDNAGGGNGVRVWLNLATGALGTSQTFGTGASLSVKVISYGSGWYRLLLTGAVPSATTYRFQINTASADASGTRVANGTYYIWNAELEEGGFASSPIATAGSTVARSAESHTLANSLIPWSATEGTILFDGHTPLGSGTQVLWQDDDGTENERFRLLRNSSNEIHFIVTDGGVTQCDLNLGTVANDTAFKVAISWAANDFLGSLNGATAVTDTSGTLPTTTTMRLGSSFTGEQSFAHCKRLMYLPVKKSAAQVEALAA